MKSKKIIYLVVISLMALPFIMISASSSYIINTSISIPKGIYKIENSKSNLKNGDLISFCLNDSEFLKFALHFKFIEKKYNGKWCNGIQPILKPIVAMQGDKVSITSQGIEVNGIILKNTKPIPAIHSMSEMKNVILKENEYIVASEEENGFDSRYYKIINLDSINSRISAIYTY